jgi:hypothetical protein
MRLLTKVAAVTGAAVLTLTTAGSALADGNGTSVNDYNQFRCHALMPDANGNYVTATDGSYCKWQGFGQNGEDSPLDSNARALVTNVLPGDFAEAYTRHSLNLNKPASQIQNLSFDVRTADIKGGSPRIVVVFANPLMDGSSYAFLSANTCAQPISSTWSRADFTGYTGTGCSIVTSNGTTYSSGGGMSAWDALVAANPDVVVSYDYMVWDQAGTYRTDRISLGTGFEYTYGNGRAVRCTTEASC